MANLLLESFPDKVALKGTQLYIAENKKYWSATSVLTPDAVFVPTSTQDVSGAIKVLVPANVAFAIRSGGTKILVSLHVCLLAHPAT